MSRDYDQLYDFINDGGVAVGLADYWDSPVDKAHRDPVSIGRIQNCGLAIACRGICYANVTADTPEIEGQSEKELFVKACEQLNIEWFETSEATGVRNARDH